MDGTGKLKIRKGISTNLINAPPVKPNIAAVLIPRFFAKRAVFTRFIELPLPDK